MKKLFLALTGLLVVAMSLIGIGQVTKVVQQNVAQNQYDQQLEEEYTANSSEESSIEQYGYQNASLTGSFTKYSTTVANQNQIYYSLSYEYAHKTGSGCATSKTVTLQLASYNKTTGALVSTYNIDTWARDTDPNSGTAFNYGTTGQIITTSGYYTLTVIPNFTLYDYKLRVQGYGNLGVTTGNCNTLQTQITSPTLNPVSPNTFVSYNWTTTPDTSTSSSVGTFTYGVTVNNPSNLLWSISITVDKISGPGAAYSQTKSFGKTSPTGATTTSQTWTGLESGTTYRATINRNTAYGEIVGWSNQIITFTIGSAVSEPTATVSSTSTASTGSDGTIVNTATITTLSDQYVYKLETSIDNGVTWVSDETGVNGGTTGTLTTTHDTLAPGTYTVKSRITYTSSSGNNLVKNLPDNTVTVSAGSTTYPEPTIDINYTSTNSTTPVAADGKITATYTCATNCNGNIQGVEIRLNGGSTWYDPTAGITGLTAGTYNVEYRISYDTSSNAGIQQAYSAISSPQSVTVNATPYGAPTASFAVTSTNETYPGAANGSVTVTPTVTPVAGTADIYYRVENTPSTNGWTSSTPSSTFTKNNLAAGTYYADVYVMYDADGNAVNGNEARLDLAEQTIQVSTTPWVSPVLNLTAVSNTPTTIDVQIDLVTGGDHEAIQNVYVELTNLGGTVLDSQTLTGAAFSDGTESFEFTSVTPGTYYVRFYYTYDVGDGQGTQTTNTFQVPVSVDADAMPYITDGVGMNKGTITNATSSATSDGDYTNDIEFADADDVIQATGNTVTLYKFNFTTNNWELYSTDAITFTGTTTKTTTISWTDELSKGYYRYDLNINVNTTGTNQVVKFVAPTLFYVDKTNPDAVTAAQQGVYVDDYTVDTNLGHDTYDITYYLTTTNTDYRGYQYVVELWDLNGTSTDVLVETQYVTHNVQEVTFNDVMANDDYEIRVYKDTTVTTGATVDGVDTTFDLTGQTSKQVTDISLDDDSGYTAYSYTDNASNQTGTITLTMIVNNPSNFNYSYDVVLYDYTTGQEVDRVTFEDTAEDCDINVFTVSQLNTTHQYYVQIENATGSLPTTLYTEFHGLAISSFTPAPTTQNNNWMTPAKASVISIGAIAIFGLIATSTYVVIRRKATK